MAFFSLLFSRFFHPICAGTLLVGGLISSPSQANDATARLDVGGIRLVENRHVRLVKEDLELSLSRVTVRYEYENISDQDFKALVAFPIPLIAANPDEMFNRDIEDPENFLDFSILADGRRMNPQIEIKAMRNGVDVSKHLTRYGIPLSRFHPDYFKALEGLSKAARKDLADLDLISWDGHGDYFYPQWEMKALYYWQQVFPAKRRISIVHSYVPLPGSGIYNTDYANPDLDKRFCIDKSTRAGIKRFTEGRKYNDLIGHELRYILTTAKTWLGPIEEFRLTIDKEQTDRIVSLCINGIKKVSPTKFEFRAYNFIPERDLDVIFFDRPDWEEN